MTTNDPTRSYRLLDRWFNTVANHPHWFIVGWLLLGLGFAALLPFATVDAELEHHFPNDYPVLQDIRAVEDQFGASHLLLVVVSSDDVLNANTLARVDALTTEFEDLADVDRVVSLTTAKRVQGGDGTLRVEPAIEEYPRTEAERSALGEELRDNPMVWGNLVSPDFRHTGILLSLLTGTGDDAILAAVGQAVAGHPGPEQITIAGNPLIRSNVYHGILWDLFHVVPFAIVLMVGFLWVSFRQLRGVVLPLLVVVVAMVVSMGLIVLLGWQIQMMLMLLPVLLIAAANDYGIHVLARYQELLSVDSIVPLREVVRKVFHSLIRPVVITGVTTMAGLLCLLAHLIVPAKQLGLLGALGIGLAVLGSLTFLPAMLLVLPRAKALGIHEAEGRRLPPLQRLLGATGRAVTRHPRAILAGAAGLVLVLSLGVLGIVVNSDYVNFYPEDHEVVRSTRLVERELGGVNTLSVTVHGDITDPAVLHQIEDLERGLLRFEAVGRVDSIATVVRELHEAVAGEGALGHRIPDTRQAVAQLLLLYSISGDPQDLEAMITADQRSAQVVARLSTSSSAAMTPVIDWVQGRIDSGETPFVTVTGNAVMLTSLAHELVTGQWTTLLLSLLAIGLLVSLLFRSAWAGLMTLLPLGVALAVLFGLMGYLGIELDVVTGVLSAIMLGIGVDYTIHFLWRYRDERIEGRSANEAVIQTLLHTGRGIVFNALSVVIAFAVLVASSFVPVKLFSFLVVVSILTCLIGALVGLPALALVTRPRFLEPGASERATRQKPHQRAA